MDKLGNASLFSFTFEILFDTMKVNLEVKDVDYEKEVDEFITRKR